MKQTALLWNVLGETGDDCPDNGGEEKSTAGTLSTTGTGTGCSDNGGEESLTAGTLSTTGTVTGPNLGTGSTSDDLV